MTTTLRDIRLAESQRDKAAVMLATVPSAVYLARLYDAVIRLYQVRSKWLKRRKTARPA